MNGLRIARWARRPMALGMVWALLATMLAAGLAQAATVTIVMEHYVFSPSPLTIVAGTTVTWVNKDPTEHQVVSDTGAFPSSKVLKTGEKFSVKFSKAGTFNYHDGLNTFMKGTLAVTAAPKATPKPTAKPAPKPTPKPTAKPTAPPTAAPTAAPTVAASTDGASPSPAAGTPGSETPGSGTTGSPDGSGGSGGSGSGSAAGSFDPGGIIIGFGLAVLAFLAGIGIQALRRERASLPPSGPGAASSVPMSVGGDAGPPGVSYSAGAPAPESAPDPDDAIDEDAPLGRG